MEQKNNNNNPFVCQDMGQADGLGQTNGKDQSNKTG